MNKGKTTKERVMKVYYTLRMMQVKVTPLPELTDMVSKLNGTTARVIICEDEDTRVVFDEKRNEFVLTITKSVEVTHSILDKCLVLKQIIMYN